MLATLCSLLWLTAQDQDAITARRIDSLLQRSSLFGFSGSFLLARGDEVLLSRGYGFSNVAQGVPNSPNSVFSVASITKPLTATAILQLAEAGKLHLTDKLSVFFSDVPVDKAEITIQQLLTHTGAIADVYAAQGVSNRELAVKKILEQPLLARKGQFAYSNDGYGLLAAIVEAASGETFEDYLRKHIFGPAGMTSSGFFRGHWSGAQVVHSYNRGIDNGLAQDHSDDWGDMGSGNLLTTAGDLFRFHRALRQHRLLKKDQIFEAPADLGRGFLYGFGWRKLISGKSSPVIYHGGADIPRGYTAEFRFYPEEDITTILLVNTMQDEIGMNRAVRDVIDAELFGGTAFVPPAIDQLGTKSKPPLGRYRLAGENYIVLRDSPTGVRLAAEGQGAINVVAATGADEAKRLLQLTESLRQACKDASEGKFGELISAELWARLSKSGPPRVLGTCPVAENEDVATTFVRFGSTSSNTVARWVWRGEESYILEGDALPLDIPLQFRSPTSLLGCDLLLRKICLVQIQESQTKITVQNEAGEFSAERVP